MNDYFENGMTGCNDLHRQVLAQVSRVPASADGQEAVKMRTSAPRRWVAFTVGALCLAVLIVLLLVYMLVPLPEWLALAVGVTIVLVFAAMMTAIGLGVATPVGWE